MTTNCSCSRSPRSSQGVFRVDVEQVQGGHHHDLARFVAARASEIVFTSGATESNNLTTQCRGSTAGTFRDARLAPVWRFSRTPTIFGEDHAAATGDSGMPFSSWRDRRLRLSRAGHPAVGIVRKLPSSFMFPVNEHTEPMQQGGNYGRQSPSRSTVRYQIDTPRTVTVAMANASHCPRSSSLMLDSMTRDSFCRRCRSCRSAICMIRSAAPGRTLS